MTDLGLLEREMYAEVEAARLLEVAPSMLHYWLEGKTGRAGKVHRPVIRQEPKGTRRPGDLGGVRRGWVVAAVPARAEGATA